MPEQNLKIGSRTVYASDSDQQVANALVLETDAVIQHSAWCAVLTGGKRLGYQHQIAQDSLVFPGRTKEQSLAIIDQSLVTSLRFEQQQKAALWKTRVSVWSVLLLGVVLIAGLLILLSCFIFNYPGM